MLNNGEIITVDYLPAVRKPEIEQADVKEIAILRCVSTDEAAWMQSLEDTWGVATLDMAAGKEKYPELYI